MHSLSRLPRIFRLPLLATAVLALGVSACETGAAPTEVSVPAEVQSTNTNLSASSAPSRSGRLRKIRGFSWEAGRTAIAVIGEDGGNLQIGRHRLIVPKKAVLQPTLFQMSVIASEHIEVTLTATSLGGMLAKRSLPGAWVENDVGSRGFRSPVELELGFETPIGEDERDKYVIVWVVNPDAPEAEQILEPVPSNWDKRGKKVTGKLKHFSRYAVGSGRL